MKIHYAKAGNGCQYARFPRLSENLVVSDDMSEVTCSKCKTYIEKHHLKYRRQFPEVPTFKPKRHGEFATFYCPVCGTKITHGWASGHRAPHCECWEDGYVLDCSPATDRSNVISFLPPLTFNKLFLASFINEEAPCAALGIVETRKQEKGFIALKAEKELGDYEQGFDLGTELLGNDRFAVLHLILNFSENNTYDVLLNLGAAATKRVLRAWQETGDYFFFVFKDGGLTAFHQSIGDEWHAYHYFDVMKNSNTTESQYASAVQALNRKSLGHGTYLDLHYQNNTDFIDLSENRFETKPIR
jgi:hypothetical protein